MDIFANVHFVKFGLISVNYAKLIFGRFLTVKFGLISVNYAKVNFGLIFLRLFLG